MMPMNPTDARLILKGAEFSGEDLGIGYRRALETCAGMRTEYAIEHQHTPGGQWHQVTGWSHEPPLNDGHTLAQDERIIRRYVTEPEEA